MSSDDRAKQSEPGAWTPLPRTLDLEAREIDPEASDKAAQSAAEGGHGESAAAEPLAEGESRAYDDEGDDAQPVAAKSARANWRWLAAAAVFLLSGGGIAGYGLVAKGYLPWPVASQSVDQIAALQERVSALESQLAKLAGSRVEPDATAAEQAAIQSRLAKLEAAAGTEPPPFTADEWQSLSARLMTAESAIRELETRAASPSGEPAAGAEQLQAVQGRLDELSKQAVARQSQLQGQLDELQARLGELSARLETEIAGARQKLSQSDRDARIAAARSLRTAYERGDDLHSWLAAIEGFSGPNAALDALRAAGQVSTLADLQRGLTLVGDSILAQSATPQGGLVAQMLANARALVRVRPQGPVAGGSPEAILTRVEAALAEGRLEDAQAEWRQLPTLAQEAGKDWTDALSARIAADAQLAELLSRLNIPADGS